MRSSTGFIGRIGFFHGHAIAFTVSLLGSLTAFSAEVNTDKSDYQPGQRVVITGQDWHPGESVLLHLTEGPPAAPAPLEWRVTADAAGAIKDTSFLILERHLGVSFNLRATGLVSGQTAITTFTDGPGTHIPPPNGIAPVNPPMGGFHIEGDPCANTPLADIGDWILPTPPPFGTGGGVLNADGSPINPATTYHIVDPFNNSSQDLIFGGGLKWFDNPGTWRWSQGKSSSKTDINNALLHFSNDADRHVWGIFSADRYSTSGDSYIDFEFLQNTLRRTETNTFSTQGPNGGRTTNDLLLSLAFTGGGKTADFFAWRWQQTGPGTFGYVDITDSLPAGRVFVALNSAIVNVPYQAFDNSTYQPNAFVEGAIDLTAFLSNLDPCMTLQVKTIMVKTKASTSNTATIEDFIDPIQVDLVIGPSAKAGTDQIRCSEGATTSFSLQGAATPGLLPIRSTTWSVVSGSATIDSPSSLATLVYVTSGSATIRLSVDSGNGCVISDDVVLTVRPLPSCEITGPTMLCPGATATFRAPAGLARYAWSISGNAAIQGSASSQSVTVLAGQECGAPFTLSLLVEQNTCISSCTMDVLVQDTTPPLLSRPSDRLLDCPADTGTNATGVATATDDCGPIQVSYSDSVQMLCGNTRIVTRTWTAIDHCGNTTSADQIITVQDRTPPSLSVPPNLTLDCPADTRVSATGMATGSDLCGQVLITHQDSVQDNCGGTEIITRTWTAMDECGNTASAIQTITVRDRTPPTLNAPGDLTLECPADIRTNATGVATASDPCGSATITYADSVEDQCGGTMIVTRTWTAMDQCGNTSSARQIITVRDTTPPSITIPRDLTLDCPADTRTNATGVATASDTCGNARISYTDSVQNHCGGTLTLARTWTATDDCGNTASGTQIITVQDVTRPTLVLPPNRTLECPADIGTNATGVATATDACTVPTITFQDAIEPKCGSTLILRRTWTATDDCGNTVSGTQIITVGDTTPPVLSLPGDVTLECPADVRTNVTGVATASDSCGIPSMHYSDQISDRCGNTFLLLRTWTATDECGNVASAVQRITVQDTTPPTISDVPDVTLECPATTEPSRTGTASAADSCGNPSVRYSDRVQNLCGGSKIVTRTWTATDECGNTASSEQIITVQDTTPPEIVCRIVNTYSKGGFGGSGGAAQLLQDNYLRLFPNGVAVGIYDPSNGNAAPNGLFWQPTMAAIDAAREFLHGGGGSSGPLARDAMNPASDNGGGGLALQTLTLTFNIKLNEAGVLGIGPNNFGLIHYTAPNDSLSGSTVSEILAAANRALAGLGLPQGYSYDDMNNLVNNLNMAFHDYSISSWVTAHLETPAVLVQCGSAIPAPNPGSVSASDTCSEPVIVSHESDVITEQSCGNRYVLLRTWVAIDRCGNQSSCTQRMIVDDTVPPTVSGLTELSVPGGQPWDFQPPTITDNCGTPLLTIVSTVTNVSAENLLVVTRVWAISDSCNDALTFQQTITVGATTAIHSTFDTSTEDWLLTGASSMVQPVHLASGGSSGGYVTYGNNISGNGWLWTAPDSFLGDRLAFYGGALTFDFMMSGSPTGTSTNQVLLFGAGLVLMNNLPAPTGNTWTSYVVPLLESAGWINAATGEPASQADMISVLASLEGLIICANHSEDITSCSLDNVALVPPAIAPDSGWLLDLQLESGQLHLSWPAIATGYRLEESDNLEQPNWGPSPVAPVLMDGMLQVVIQPSSRQKFYRLHRL